MEITKEQLLKVVNVALADQEGYEPWMRFEDIEILGGKLNFRFLDSLSHGVETDLEPAEVRRTYNAAIQAAIPTLV
ncbi:hypothetical protein [Alloalcanivorax xenomutans]|uniref:hypothetical protein n=1 Tax=Alloalcanivorax xenomutans TaxID=1094342 RepID=UPI002931510E|nr:hypothetical protein [Alloalcanivorax xenomutans]WOA32661.1 hypothetical protein RVY87_06155 [Alloalcanivorax xenomutans]